MPPGRLHRSAPESSPILATFPPNNGTDPCPGPQAGAQNPRATGGTKASSSGERFSRLPSTCGGCSPIVPKRTSSACAQADAQRPVEIAPKGPGVPPGMSSRSTGLMLREGVLPSVRARAAPQGMSPCRAAVGGPARYPRNITGSLQDNRRLFPCVESLAILARAMVRRS